MLKVILLNAILLNAILLNAILLNAILLNVVSHKNVLVSWRTKGNWLTLQSQSMQHLKKSFFFRSEKNVSEPQTLKQLWVAVFFHRGRKEFNLTMVMR